MQELAMWPGAKGKNWNCLDNWVSLYFDLLGKGGVNTHEAVFFLRRVSYFFVHLGDLRANNCQVMVYIYLGF